MDTSQISFNNNEEDSQFVVKTGNNRGAIEYEKHSHDHLDMYHTEVDPELEGKGIAKVLVQRALEYCQANNWKVTPSCTYVAAYIQKHPEFQELLKNPA